MPCIKCLNQVHQGPCGPCQDLGCTDKTSHGTLACPARLAKATAGKNKHITSVGSVTTLPLPANRSRAVALQTMLASAESPLSIDEAAKSIRILLGSGAQRTLVTKDFVDKLGLRTLRKETTAVQGFDQEHVSTRSYDVVMLNIYKAGWPKCVSIEAMVVKSINKIHQPGIFATAEKFESQGYVLADDRLISSKSDIIISDTLIGSIT